MLVSAAEDNTTECESHTLEAALHSLNQAQSLTPGLVPEKVHVT